MLSLEADGLQQQPLLSAKTEAESVDPSCLVSTGKASGGGLMVWWIVFGILWAP